ncbi:hypothetical protein, conserved, partial [Trypanosoma cruzi]
GGGGLCVLFGVSFGVSCCECTERLPPCNSRGAGACLLFYLTLFLCVCVQLRLGRVRREERDGVVGRRRRKHKKKVLERGGDIHIYITQIPKRMARKTVTTDVDPMLQETYLQDDSKDFLPTSEALDRFDAQLAKGEPVHSEPSLKRRMPQARGANSLPCRRSFEAASQQPQQQKQQQLYQQYCGRRSSNDAPFQANKGLPEEAQERLEDIEAVRRLGNDMAGNDD